MVRLICSKAHVLKNSIEENDPFKKRQEASEEAYFLTHRNKKLNYNIKTRVEVSLILQLWRSKINSNSSYIHREVYINRHFLTSSLHITEFKYIKEADFHYGSKFIILIFVYFCDTAVFQSLIFNNILLIDKNKTSFRGTIEYFRCIHAYGTYIL